MIRINSNDVYSLIFLYDFTHQVKSVQYLLLVQYWLLYKRELKKVLTFSGISSHIRQITMIHLRTLVISVTGE